MRSAKSIKKKLAGVVILALVAVVANATVIGTVYVDPAISPAGTTGTPAVNGITDHIGGFMEMYSQPIPEDGVQIQVCGNGCALFQMNYAGQWVNV
jgi:hypothetical protein